MKTEQPKTRSIELDITIDAPVEKVWTAIAQPEQLANWFPLTAHGTTGKGGKVSLSWGTTPEWTTTIDVWEPNAHLRFVDPPAAEGFPLTAVDFRLETTGGSTVVRLVNSGFSAEADWDEMFDATIGGWTYFLFNLKRYVERHFNTSREMVWVRRKTKKSPEDIWRDVLGPKGLAIADDVSVLGQGDAYSCTSLSERIDGQIHLVSAPAHFAGTAETLDGGLLFVEVEPGRESRHVGIWLSTYGLEARRVNALQDTLNYIADGVFGKER